MATLSVEGRFLQVNEALCRYLGYAADELKARSFNDVTHEDDHEECDAAFGRILSGESEDFTLEKRYVRKDGTVVWSHVMVVAVRERGRLLHMIGVAVDITPRKEAMEKLRQSEERYRSLYNRAPVMMHSVDPRGVLLNVSDIWLSSLGYSREEVLGRPLTDFLEMASKRFATEVVFPRLFSTGSCRDVDYRVLKKNGEVMDVRLSATVERDPGGRPIRTLAAMVDVTARRRVERELELTEQRQRRLYERAPALLYSTDPDGAMTLVSDAWLTAFGYTREQVIGRSCDEFLRPDQARGGAATALSELFRSGACAQVPYIARTSKGADVEVLLSAVPLRGDQGQLLGYMVDLVDVTERNAADAKLHKLREELEELVRVRTRDLEYRNALLTAQTDASLNGILVLDEDERITSYNRRFAELWGIPPGLLASGSDKQALSFALTQLQAPDEFLERVRYLYDHRNEVSQDEVRLKDDRTFERYSAPVVTESGKYCGRVWEFRDITRRARAERELERRTRQLAASNAELEIFAAAASHDLSAPLRKILAFGEILDRRARHRLEPQDQQLLDRIRNSSKRMAGLIADVLTLARVGRQSMPTEEVDLGKTLKEVLSDLDASTAAAVEAGPLPVVRAHGVLMRRLLQNLVSNAVKFARPDVALRLVVDAQPSEAAGVMISFRDNGIGFDDALSEKIFEPFRRLNPVSAFEGSGLGLAICRRIVERYGGLMAAHGDPGRGATITVWLPASAVVRL